MENFEETGNPHHAEWCRWEEYWIPHHAECCLREDYWIPHNAECCILQKYWIPHYAEEGKSKDFPLFRSKLMKMRVQTTIFMDFRPLFAVRTVSGEPTSL